MSQKPLSYETLKNQINDLSTNNQPVADQNTGWSYKTYLSPPYVLAAIPIAIAVMLYFIKPFFIMEKENDQRGDEHVYMSSKKLGVFTVGFSALFIGGYYYYYGKMPAEEV